MKISVHELAACALAVTCGLAVLFLPQYAAMLYVQGAVLYLHKAMHVDVALARHGIRSSITLSVVYAGIWPVLLVLQFIGLTWTLLRGFARLLARPFKRA